MQPVPEVVTDRPEGEEVMVALPAGSVGAKATPLKLESAGAVSSSVKLVLGLVVVARVFGGSWLRS